MWKSIAFSGLAAGLSLTVILYERFGARTLSVSPLNL